jgi:hypothetical protein
LEQLFSVLVSLHHETPRHGEWVVACLQGAWPKLIGHRLASVCRPAAFKDSELVVEIIDRDWEEAVRSVEPALLEKLRAATAGVVKSISLTKQSSQP